jgi:2-polyprenyl-3-methyl-5-hydroxy-6-metoxy-1,4-benzoquinol methylase
VKAGRALDIGCGTGTNVLYLAEKGFDVCGVDISKVAIRKAVGPPGLDEQEVERKFSN